VVSLESFQAEGGSRCGDDAETGIVDEDGPWHYRCRCGGVYTITTDELEQGHHLVACNSCSEVIWVGYKLAEDGEDEWIG